MKKRIVAFALAALMLLLAACGSQPTGQNKNENTPSQTTVITPAERFAKGSGTEADPYRIATPEELMHLQATVNEQGNTDYLAAHFRLEQDIDLQNAAWRAIGWTASGENKTFTGSFDGAGHTVSNFYTTLGSAEDVSFRYLGLFCTVGGTVSNLTVDGAALHAEQGNDYTGAIAANLDFGGRIENCTAGKNCDLSGGRVGGIVGDSKGEIVNCASAAGVTGMTTTGHAGGIVGYHWKARLENCANTGAVTGMQTAGGIAGSLVGSIMNCTNAGSVNGAKYAGGVVGHLTQNPTGNEHNLTDLTVANCSNAGAVHSDETAGGVVGHLGATGVGFVVLNNCSNAGSITGFATLGGVLGSVTGRAAVTLRLQVCSNSGSLSAANDLFATLGGVLGSLTCSSGEQIELLQCTNEGALTSGTGYAGGILGIYSGTLAGEEDQTCLKLSSCVNSGAVKGGSRGTGGMAGVISAKNYPNLTLTLDSCINNSDVMTMGVGGVAGGMVGVLEPTHVAARFAYCSNNGAVAAVEAELSEADEAFGFHVPLGGMVGMVGLDSVRIDPNSACEGGEIAFESCQNLGSLVKNDDGQSFHTADMIGLNQMN